VAKALTLLTHKLKKGPGFLFFSFSNLSAVRDGPPMAEPNAFDGVCPIFDSYCVI
jgi:hypothetical protein